MKHEGPRDDEHDDGDSPERDEKKRGRDRWAVWARRGVLIFQALAASANAVIGLVELIDLLSRLQ